MGKYSTPETPSADPQIGAAALLQAQTGSDWLAFSRDAFAVSQERQADLDKLTQRVTKQQLATSRKQFKWARQDRRRYARVFQPIEDEFIREASTYASPERQQEAAAEARADVQSASASQRAQTLREQSSLGVRPDSGRHAGVSRAAELGAAVASAGAANQARQGVRDKGLALKADVANLGRGLPAQSSQAASLGLGAGSGAVGLNLNANQQYLASTGIMNSGFAGQMRGAAGQASTLNNLYSNQISGWAAQQKYGPDLLSDIGAGVGLVGGILSTREAKTKGKTVAPGLALKAVKDMPVETWSYKEGVADGRAGGGPEHVGTYAEDFKKITGLGSDHMIPVGDAIGITMKAVQDLDEKVDRIAAGRGGGRKPERMAA